MKRAVLTDGTGRWFDTEKVEHFAEGTKWDGSNHISKATGGQWEHESLYRTAGGLWILNCWSNYQGSQDSYEEVSSEESAKWVLKNDYEPHIACIKEYARLEIK